METTFDVVVYSLGRPDAKSVEVQFTRVNGNDKEMPPQFRSGLVMTSAEAKRLGLTIGQEVQLVLRTVPNGD